MAYFPDLTPYRYLGGRERPGFVNVGWLAAGKPVPTGPLPAGFADALEAVARRYGGRNITRGIHFCEFCEAVCVAPAGNGEVHVPGTGVTYVAPTLLMHYVADHGYAPPEVFVAAVFAAL